MLGDSDMVCRRPPDALLAAALLCVCAVSDSRRTRCASSMCDEERFRRLCFVEGDGDSTCGPSALLLLLRQF